MCVQKESCICKVYRYFYEEIIKACHYIASWFFLVVVSLLLFKVKNLKDVALEDFIKSQTF